MVTSPVASVPEELTLITSPATNPCACGVVNTPVPLLAVTVAVIPPLMTVDTDPEVVETAYCLNLVEVATVPVAAVTTNTAVIAAVALNTTVDAVGIAAT